MRESDHKLDDDLAAYAALDGLIAQARTQPDPRQWTRHQVRVALDRLDTIERPPAVKVEAKRQLLAIERRMLSALLHQSASNPLRVVARPQPVHHKIAQSFD